MPHFLPHSFIAAPGALCLIPFIAAGGYVIFFAVVHLFAWLMEVELFRSYFTLQCNLETDGRAWAYLNEFMCIGKNRNNCFVCLTSSIPIEMSVTEGGASLAILQEKVTLLHVIILGI